MKKLNAGYTLDQTILVVSIVAILSTIIVSQLGSTVMNRAHGLKISANLKQVSQANRIFKVYHNAWPHEATGNRSSFDNASALVSSKYLRNTAQKNNNRNFLPGYKIVDGKLRHDLGIGGEIEQSIQRYEGQNYLVVTMNNIPLSEVKAADQIIDGSINGEDGHLHFDTDGRMATIHYLSTPIN